MHNEWVLAAHLELSLFMGVALAQAAATLRRSRSIREAHGGDGRMLRIVSRPLSRAP
jgi:hypothetical protein